MRVEHLKVFAGAAATAATILIAVVGSSPAMNEPRGQAQESTPTATATRTIQSPGGVVCVKYDEDVDNDCHVTVLDLSRVAAKFGPVPTVAPTETPIPATETAVTAPNTPTPTVTPSATPTATRTATATATPTLPPTSTPTATPTPSAALRDKFTHPFASDSTWNLPIGSGAVLKPAGLSVSSGTFREEVVVIHTPNLAPQPFYFSSLHPAAPINGPGHWSNNSRCESSGVLAFSAPAPPGFLIPDTSTDRGGTSNGEHGGTPNHPSAIMTADGNAIIETQPTTHCAGDPYTTGFVQGTFSIYGDGRFGSQGGSHMSGLGGTIRLGETAAALTRGYYNHALKTVLGPGNFSDRVSLGRGWSWPASGSDCGNTACGYSGADTHSDGSPRNVHMGTLLTVPQSYNCAQFANAWVRAYCRTAQLYGVYIVDSGWGPVYVPLEFSPSGDAYVEVNAACGCDINATSGAVQSQMATLFTQMSYVSNASPTTPKGGGSPVVPLSPPIGN